MSIDLQQQIRKMNWRICQLEKQVTASVRQQFVIGANPDLAVDVVKYTIPNLRVKLNSVEVYLDNAIMVQTLADRKSYTVDYSNLDKVVVTFNGTTQTEQVYIIRYEYFVYPQNTKCNQ